MASTLKKRKSVSHIRQINNQKDTDSDGSSPTTKSKAKPITGAAPTTLDLSKVKNPLHEGPVSANTRCAELPLYDEEHISPWLKGNSFIRSYYRCGYTTKQCLQSVFAIHNETGNIWTHIIGVLIVVTLSGHVLLHLGLTRTWDYFVFLLFELCSLMMLGGSSVYHMLAAHHCETVHNVALSLDYFGITCMIIGSFYPPVFYIFSCMKLTRFMYLSAVTVLGAIGLVGPFFSFFNDPSFFWIRIALHTTLTSIGVLPAVHVMFGFPTNESTRPLYQGLLLMLATYFVGMIIYIFKVPERWFSGHFDLFLNSHQLWHFFVLTAAVIHYFTCMGAFQLWRVTGEAGGDCA